MKLNSIRWRLPINFAAIALLSTLASGILLLVTLRSYYANQERLYLQSNAERMAMMVREMKRANLPEFALREQVKSWSFFLQARVQLLDERGALLVDSGLPEFHQVLTVSGLPDENVRFLFKKEVIAPKKGLEEGSNPTGQPQDMLMILPSDKPILSKGTLISTTTFTTTLGTDEKGVGVFMAIAPSSYGYNLGTVAVVPPNRSKESVEQPIQSDAGDKMGALILSDGPAYGREIVADAARAGAVAGLVAVILAGAAGWIISNRMTQPLIALTATTQKMAAGDLSARANPQVSDEIGLLATSFNEMASTIEGTVQALRRFVADAAHQVQTPLTALRTDLELALKDTHSSQQAEYLERAAEQTQRLSELAQSLLELSRLESGLSDQAAPQEQVDLAGLVKETCEIYASQAEQKGQTFNVGIEGPVSPITGNPVLLRQAVGNVLENAIKFTPQGGEIQVIVAEADQGVIISIEDNGIGIPVEDKPHLFDRFHRGHNVSAYPGNGLGLAIVKAIVQAHGGEVWAEDGSKGGTRMSLRIPI